MTTQVHDSGEEYVIRTTYGDLTAVSSGDVSLYNDSTDALSDSSDVGAISTEPAGASFARQSVSFPGDVTLQFDGSTNFQGIYADQTYDTGDSTQTVDSYFAVVNYQQKADGSASDHLLHTGDLNQSFDLSGIDQLTLSSAGITAN